MYYTIGWLLHDPIVHICTWWVSTEKDELNSWTYAEFHAADLGLMPSSLSRAFRARTAPSDRGGECCWRTGLCRETGPNPGLNCTLALLTSIFQQNWGKEKKKAVSFVNQSQSTNCWAGTFKSQHRWRLIKIAPLLDITSDPVSCAEQNS